MSAMLVLACTPATINTLVIAMTSGELSADRHDVIARHLRFYAGVWSATSPWFTVVIVAELIASVALVMFAAGCSDRRTRRGAPEACTPSVTDRPGEDHR